MINYFEAHLKKLWVMDDFLFRSQGALIGCLIGLAFTVTLNVGAVSLSIQHPTLPSVSTDGCPLSDNTTDWGYTAKLHDNF